MGKKHKYRFSFMREWSDEDESETQCYDDLIEPLKQIIIEGYKIERKPVMSFSYRGFNIGPKERLFSPNPEERFSFRWLNNESKFNRTLLDNVLVTAVQLGIEQGRRLERNFMVHNNILENILKSKIERINELENQLSKLDSSFIVKQPIPTISDHIEDFEIDIPIEEEEEEQVVLVN